MKFVRWWILPVLVLCVACATPVKLAGKAAWFAVKLGTGLAWNIATGIGKIGAKEAIHAVDLTADASMKILASQQSYLLVSAFWNHMRGGTFADAYRLLSDALKKDMRKQAFYDYAKSWAPNISSADILDPHVQQFHVEIPTRVQIAKEGDKADMRVVVYVSKIKDKWRITGWEGIPPPGAAK